MKIQNFHLKIDNSNPVIASAISAQSKPKVKVGNLNTVTAFAISPIKNESSTFRLAVVRSTFFHLYEFNFDFFLLYLLKI